MQTLPSLSNVEDKLVRQGVVKSGFREEERRKARFRAEPGGHLDFRTQPADFRQPGYPAPPASFLLPA